MTVIIVNRDMNSARNVTVNLDNFRLLMEITGLCSCHRFPELKPLCHTRKCTEGEPDFIKLKFFYHIRACAFYNCSSVGRANREICPRMLHGLPK